MGGTIGTVNRRDNVAAMIGTFIAALPDLKATEQVVVAEGDYDLAWSQFLVSFTPVRHRSPVVA